MANPATLVPAAHKLTVEEQSKGGKKSGESRRRTADLRRAARDALSKKYKLDDGTEVTGDELVLMSIFENIADPDSRNFGKSLEMLVSLLNEKHSPEEKKRMKAETKLIEKRVNDSANSDEHVTVVIDV